MTSLSSFKAFCFFFGLAFVDFSLKKRKRERESRIIFCMNFCHFMTKPKKKRKSATYPKEFFWEKNGTKLHCKNIAGFFKL